MMNVAAWSGSLLAWENELSLLKARLGPVFGRRELREAGGAFLDGLLSGIARKTGWMMSEQAGFARPWRIQGLLGRNRWDADALRDGIRAYVVEALGSDDGVHVVDETGFLKQCRHSVGVARQYGGTAGRIENCQIGVFLGYAGRFGQALIDRQLYLPKDWASDTERRAKASIPQEVTFATKPAVARQMISRTLGAGIPCAWVLADTVYGSDFHLRSMLEGRDKAHVLAVRSNHFLQFIGAEGTVETSPAEIAAASGPMPSRPTPQAQAARAFGSTTGPVSRCRGFARMAGNDWCWSASPGRTRTSGHTILSSVPPAPPWRNWPGSPACAGPSRNAYRGPRTISASITARSGRGTAGTAT